jgi:hypothetical protein
MVLIDLLHKEILQLQNKNLLILPKEKERLELCLKTMKKLAGVKL